MILIEEEKFNSKKLYFLFFNMNKIKFWSKKHLK